jgi:hypothetical protein
MWVVAQEGFIVIKDVKKGYHPRTNLVKDESSYLFADPLKIFNKHKNCFCQLLKVHGTGDIRQTEMHTGKPLVPRPSASKVEVEKAQIVRCWSDSNRTDSVVQA